MARGERRYIVIEDWRKFQHYKDRSPLWIKNYTELMHDDDYLGLTGNRRAILHGLWLEYATSRCRVADDTAVLSRRLALKVTRRDLEALNHAGFITFSASKPLAERYQDASPEVEREEEKELRPSSSLQGPTPRERRDAIRETIDDDLEKALAELRPSTAQRSRILRAKSEEPQRLRDCLRAALERGHGIEPYLDELLVNGSWPEPIPDPATLAAGSTIEIGLAWQRYVRGYDWDETFTANDMLAELTRIRASNRVTGYIADTDALATWETERARRYDPEPGIPGVTTTAEGATVPAK